MSNTRPRPGDDESALLPLEPDAGPRDFDLVLRGYDRLQVDRHLSYLERLLQTAQAETAELREQLATARADAARATPSWEALGARVTEILRLAEEEGTAIRAAAEQDANEIRAAAQREVAALARRRDAIRAELARVHSSLGPTATTVDPAGATGV